MPNAAGNELGRYPQVLKELGILSPLTFDAFLKAIYLSRVALTTPLFTPDYRSLILSLVGC